ncbi:LLM class flavin-dependent oxidoreductase [Rummeliibacillus pycnus]|uniref:LLM class flavin-dependent oxidoreductase n=1 Tax=Rummeliibacillus pycnus TaxID=101070 RepID=UPI000C9C6534|nr:LLM class flavin-dependent oxidoreductase [Rummeliibacillus pycnus]
MTNPHFYWFAPTNGDGEFLGLKEAERNPTADYLVKVAQTAEDAGFEGILIPTGIPYLDSWMVGSAIIHRTKNIKPLVAFRPGFISPTVASKLAATFDQFAHGRLLINVVTGGSAKELGQDGDFVDHQTRYERTEEFLDVIKKSWHHHPFDHKGEFFNIEQGTLMPSLYQQDGIPIYFGGSSDIAKEIAAKSADVYLQWGEPVLKIQEQIEDVKKRATKYNRSLEFGIRIHVVVRETEEEAWEAAHHIISQVDQSVQTKMTGVFSESDSVAQKRMTEITQQGDRFDKYSWSGIGKIRKGAGTAIVGTPEQVQEALQDYIKVGVQHFILSGFPHIEEAERFGKLVLPKFNAVSIQQS